MAEISIVIPVYNAARFLREALESLQAQTFTEWECICVNDGSTDESPAIIREMMASDPRGLGFMRDGPQLPLWDVGDVVLALWKKGGVLG